MKNSKTRIIILISVLAVAVLGSVFVSIGMEWFNSLIKPTQWIPNIVIPIVWTIIYIAFAVVLSLWVSKEKLPVSVVAYLILNGVLNVLWCLCFFALKLTFIGNIVIVLNLCAGYLLIKSIYRQNKLYAFILFIYPLWLSIATTLNLALWILN